MVANHRCYEGDHMFSNKKRKCDGNMVSKVRKEFILSTKQHDGCKEVGAKLELKVGTKVEQIQLYESQAPRALWHEEKPTVHQKRGTKRKQPGDMEPPVFLNDRVPEEDTVVNTAGHMRNTSVFLNERVPEEEMPDNTAGPTPNTSADRPRPLVRVGLTTFVGLLFMSALSVGFASLAVPMFNPMVDLIVDLMDDLADDLALVMGALRVDLMVALMLDLMGTPKYVLMVTLIVALREPLWWNLWVPLQYALMSTLTGAPMEALRFTLMDSQMCAFMRVLLVVLRFTLMGTMIAIVE
eukprot:gene29270-12511_t